MFSITRLKPSGHPRPFCKLYSVLVYWCWTFSFVFRCVSHKVCYSTQLMVWFLLRHLNTCFGFWILYTFLSPVTSYFLMLGPVLWFLEYYWLDPHETLHMDSLPGVPGIFETCRFIVIGPYMLHEVTLYSRISNCNFVSSNCTLVKLYKAIHWRIQIIMLYYVHIYILF